MLSQTLTEIFSEKIVESLSDDDIKKYITGLYKEFKLKTFSTSDFKSAFKKDKITLKLIKELVQDGYFERKKAGLYALTQKSEDLVSTSDISANTASKNVKQKLDTAIKKKAKRFRVPATARGDAFDNLVREVIQNMNANIKQAAAEKLMFAGIPGTGKTSSAVQLSILFGMNLIIIEGSHISEEDIINIPYVVQRGNKQTKNVAQYKSSGSDFEIIDAKSSLVSQMDNLGYIRDAEYQKMLNSNKLMKKVYLKYKKFIDAVRRTPQHKSGFKTILLVDEFFRTNDKKIMNLLRTILNGQIGTTDIPKDTYLIFASNFDNTDGSLDEIPLNQQFTKVNFDIPSPDDFMAYVADKYTPYDAETGEEDDEVKGSVELQPEVYNAFQENIGPKDMGTVENGVVISPRRMEQIMLYVNSKIPLQSQEEARSLMTFLDINFTNYIEGSKSTKLLAKYKNIVKDIIVKTSPNISTDDLAPLPDTQWKQVLSDEIDAKLSIKGDRTYPAVLSGAPGTSKTYTVKKVAEDKNMGLITIDVSSLTTDDVDGIPVPETDANGNIETKFTEPPLYKRIMNQYEKQYKDVYQEDRPYNYILFLDELTRTTTQIFNKIRLLLLEKKVNSSYPIPDDIMIISAQNPSDDGAIELPDHVRDVVDVIPVEMAIEDTEGYMKGLFEHYSDEETTLKFPVQQISFNLVSEIYNRFKTDHDSDGNKKIVQVQPFFWSIGDYTVIYVSPREIVDLFQGTIQRIHDNFMFDGWDEIDEYNDKVFEEFIGQAKLYTYKKYEGMLDFIADKQGVESVDINKFKKIIKTIIENSSIFDLIKEQKSAVVQSQSFSSLFSAVNYDLKDLLANDGQIIVENWLNSLSDYTQAAADIQVLFGDVVKKGFKTLYFFIIDFIKFLEKIDWNNVQGGTFDQLLIILKAQINEMIKSDDFVMAWIDLDDKDSDLLTDAIERLNALDI